MKKIYSIIIILLLAYLIRTYIIEGIYIASESMEPALQKGEFFFVDKISFFFRNPKRFEIVIIKPPDLENKELVKRIIGLPGDTISIINKKVFINNIPLDENYVIYKRKRELLVGDNLGPLNIPDESYFVMGDNRDESKDSRDFFDKKGKHLYYITIDNIKGRLIKIF